MAEVIHDADGDHTRIQTTEARQGRWGRHAFWVLVVSLALVVLALFGSWAMRAGDLQSTEGKEAHRTAPQATTIEPPAQTGPTSTPNP